MEILQKTLILLIFWHSFGAYSQKETKDTLYFGIEGEVINIKTNEPIIQAHLEITNKAGVSKQFITDSNGMFYIPLAKNEYYSLVVSKDGFLNAKGYETTLNTKKSKVFYHVYAMQPSTCGRFGPFFFFESNSVLPIDSGLDLRNYSEELAYFLKMLQENPNVIFNIIPSKSKNEDSSLPEKRAAFIYDALIKEGGNPNQITVGPGTPFIPYQKYPYVTIQAKGIIE